MLLNIERRLSGMCHLQRVEVEIDMVAIKDLMGRSVWQLTIQSC